MRYRLDVVAATVIDVVRFAGGWIFDRSMAGWDVTVLVADHPDVRPLQIVGARVLDLEDALTSVQSRPRPQALAAAADLFGCEPRVRQGVLQALDHGVTEVTLWGRTGRRTRRKRRTGATPAEHGRPDVQGAGPGGRVECRGRPAASRGARRDLSERSFGVAVGRRRSGARQLIRRAGGTHDGSTCRPSRRADGTPR